MYRCAFPFAGALAAALAFASPAWSQVARNFPQNALRGEMIVGNPPEITLNGRPARLSPGSRIRNRDNMLAMSGSLGGAPLLVNYTVDTSGLVHDVWILRADEAARKPWPATAEQSRTWTFDPVAQSWTRP